MTTTFDITNNVGKVRLKISDNVTDSYIFSDEELTYFLTANSDSIRLASADALEAWAATYAANADSEKIGDYAYTQKIIANMKSLAKSLRDQEEAYPIFEMSEMDLTGEDA